MHEHEHGCSCCHSHEHEHEHEEEYGCSCCHSHEHGEEEHSKKEMIILMVRVVIGLALALLGLLWLNEDNFSWWVNLIVMGAAWLVVSYDVAWRSIKNIIHLENPFDECMLMTVASVGAFCIRFFGPEHNEFFEAVMVMLLYQLGEFFEDLAADKSREAITKAIDIRDQKATVINPDGSYIEKNAEDLAIGDIVLLKVGEKCLCDGVVIEGSGAMDESSVTGEYLPVDKDPQSAVLSGTILKNGSLKVEVSKEYKDSTVAKLLDMVQHSASKKSKVDRFITSFARWYTPIVMILAVLVAILPPLFLGINDGNVWSRWVLTALSFLVISCPCAVVISVPLAYFAGLGLASSNGIVIKGSEYFDKLNKMKYVAFDKTGTLTKGQFIIEKIYSPTLNEETFNEFILAAEARSNHPIAQAICAGHDLSAISEEITSYEEIPGLGVKVGYKGHNIEAISTPRDPQNACKENGTLVYLIVDDKDEGFVLLNDEIKPDARQTVQNLKNMGYTTILLSGDKKVHVDQVALEVGVDEAHGELLPEDKVKYIEEKMAKQDGMVAFVGDGINDAPSIVGADIGFGMGGLGSDVVVQNADIVLMDDSLDKIVTSAKIAKKTQRKAMVNIVVALLIKFGVMLAAALWSGFPLWLATLADSGLALALVLNSLLLLKAKVK